jgi:hypothetical protein
MYSKNPTIPIPPELAALRAAVFRAKTEKRHAVRHASIEEKLRMLEEMRDFTASVRHLREENKANVRSAWPQA